MKQRMILSGCLFLALGFVLILLGTTAGRLLQKNADEKDLYEKRWAMIKWFFIAGSFAFVIGILCLIFR